MKTRNGFVSNSSSSSFIVIGHAASTNAIQEMQARHVYNGEFSIYAKDGKNEFGWESIKTEDTNSRLIFAYLQARYVKKDKPQYMRLLNKVIKKALGAKRIHWNIADWEGYIDHQSCASEGANEEMFRSEDELTRFIFSDESYIQGGNDNG